MKIFLISFYLFSLSLQKLNGFESNIEIINSSCKIVFQKMEYLFSIMNYYTQNIESFDTNHQLFNQEYLDTFNHFTQKIGLSKGEVIRQNKLILKNIYFVYHREKAFDLYLKDDYSSLVQFLAHLDLEANIQELFRDFVGQKNLLFYDVRQMYSEINEMTIIILNFYDHVESLLDEVMFDKTTSNKNITIQNLQTYKYILGFLSELVNIKEKFNKKKENLETLFINWNENEENFDNALETLKLYYHRRYVEGILDEENQQSNEIEDPEAIEEHLHEQGDNDDDEEDNRDPIQICDNILMSNYFLQGIEKAEEIEKFEEIDECKNIKHTCCEREQLKTSFMKFNQSIIPYITKKYKVLNEILFFLVNNYKTFAKYAYDLQKLENLNPVCKHTSKNLIFTPINKNFISKFKEQMNKAHKFAVGSKNGMLCSLCDYDFHKVLAEDKKIKFSQQFCEEMIDQTFDFTSVLHLQLIDYMNNLISTLQCDIQTGEKKLETNIFFEEDKTSLNMLIDCEENNRQNCHAYCESFYFTKFESTYDIDFEKIGKMYEFIFDKVNTLRLKTTELINLNSLRYFYQDVLMEKSDQGQKSIDSVKREIIIGIDEENNGQDPLTDGTELDLDKDFN